VVITSNSIVLSPTSFKSICVTYDYNKRLNIRAVSGLCIYARHPTDPSKVFDESLLAKLELYGVIGKIHSWRSSYLTGRTQEHGNTASRWKHFKYKDVYFVM
jgi:hypothetical protein